MFEENVLHSSNSNFLPHSLEEYAVEEKASKVEENVVSRRKSKPIGNILEWKQCYLRCTSCESLAHLIWTCFSFINEGELVNISTVILEIIGDRPLEVRSDP